MAIFLRLYLQKVVVVLKNNEVYTKKEGKNEEAVNNMLEKLNVAKEKITTLNCDDIYKNFYNIDISKIKNLKFEN